MRRRDRAEDAVAAALPGAVLGGLTGGCLWAAFGLPFLASAGTAAAAGAAVFAVVGWRRDRGEVRGWLWWWWYCLDWLRFLG